MVPYWQAFMDLHAQRQYGEHGPQPLMFQEIAAFLALDGHWVPPTAHRKFSRLMRRLDSAYLDLVAKRRVKAAEGSPYG